MNEPKWITRGRPANPGLDFEGLRQRGVQILQQLSGDVWTDYNEHDPGVTTLEQLCYALTELSYRADLPVETLLADPSTARIDPSRAALFRPDAILPSAPVTERDWRRLLIDRVPGVGNAWLKPARASGSGAVDGLHEIELYVPDREASSNPARRRTAVRIARRTYLRHRGFCEDVVGIHILTPLPAELGATVTIEPGATPELVLARIFYQVGQHLAPEVRWQPVDRLVADGVPPAGIFSGPRLRGGLIDDTQLQPRSMHVALDDLERVLSDVDAVTGVRDVQLGTASARLDSTGASTLAIPRRHVLVLDTRDVDRTFRVRLFANGVERRPEPVLVASELRRLWADHRRRYESRSLHDPSSGPLRADPDLGAYHSIQHHFPNAYGVNAYGLPADATELRRAQARQFKAYLLVFEQLLADAFARLPAIRNLFSTDRHPSRPLFRYIDTSVPDAGPLLQPEYRRRLPDVARTGDRPLERRNRVLDLMLATYGESIGPVAPLSPSHWERSNSAPLRAEVRAKRTLLRQLPRLGRRGGCGPDYLAAPSSKLAHSGLEIRSRIQLGMDPFPRPLEEWMDRGGLRLTGTAPPAERAMMLRHARHIDAEFERVVHAPAPATDRHGPRTVSEDVWLAAGALDHYRVGRLPGDAALTVVCRAPSQPLWQLIGQYPDRETAVADISALLAVVRRVDPHLRRLTVVEHTLLRFGRAGMHEREGAAPFEYPFTATAVVALPAREAADHAIRARIHDVLRANAPAHVVLDVSFLRLGHAAEFEALHAEWRRALRDRRGLDLIDACRRLREFLRSGVE